MTPPDEPPPKQDQSTVLPIASLIMLTEFLYELRERDPEFAAAVARRLRRTGTAEDGWAERAPDSIKLVRLMADYLGKAGQ